jgi:hypothetical protein
VWNREPLHHDINQMCYVQIQISGVNFCAFSIVRRAWSKSRVIEDHHRCSWLCSPVHSFNNRSRFRQQTSVNYFQCPSHHLIMLNAIASSSRIASRSVHTSAVALASSSTARSVPVPGYNNYVTPLRKLIVDYHPEAPSQRGLR